MSKSIVAHVKRRIQGGTRGSQIIVRSCAKRNKDGDVQFDARFAGTAQSSRWAAGELGSTTPAYPVLMGVYFGHTGAMEFERDVEALARNANKEFA